MSKARSPRALDSMTIGTSIRLLLGGFRPGCVLLGNRRGRLHSLCIGPERAIDQRVDQFTVAQGHPQVTAAPSRGQVFGQPRIVAVARQLVVDLSLDLVVGGVDPLLLGN